MIVNFLILSFIGAVVIGAVAHNPEKAVSRVKSFAIFLIQLIAIFAVIAVFMQFRTAFH